MRREAGGEVAAAAGRAAARAADTPVEALPRAGDSPVAAPHRAEASVVAGLPCRPEAGSVNPAIRGLMRSKVGKSLRASGRTA